MRFLMLEIVIIVNYALCIKISNKYFKSLQACCTRNLTDHNQSSFNEIPGIEYQNGDDGYAAISKYRDSGPVRSPNQLENARRSAVVVDFNLSAAGYSRRRGPDLNSGRLRDFRRKLFSQGISVLPEGNSPYPSNSLRIVSMTQFPKYF